MTTTVIRGGRVIDPVEGRDEIADVWMVDGVFADASSEEVGREVDAEGMIVCPGFIETQATLQESGWEEGETIATATAAAVAGGVTSLACLPERSLSWTTAQRLSSFVVRRNGPGCATCSRWER